MYNKLLTGVCHTRCGLLEDAAHVGVEFGYRRVRDNQVIACVEPLITGIEWLRLCQYVVSEEV